MSFHTLFHPHSSLSFDTALTHPQGNAASPVWGYAQLLPWICKRKMLCYATLNYVGLCWSVTDSSLIHTVYYLPQSVYAKLHFGFVLSHFTVSLVAWRELGINFFPGLGAPVKFQTAWVCLCVYIAQRTQKLWLAYILSLSVFSSPTLPSISHFTSPSLTFCLTSSLRLCHLLSGPKTLLATDLSSTGLMQPAVRREPLRDHLNKVGLKEKIDR